MGWRDKVLYSLELGSWFGYEAFRLVSIISIPGSFVVGSLVRGIPRIQIII
jgi:hypothetical protein